MENHTKSPRQNKRTITKRNTLYFSLESRCLYGSPKVTSLLRTAGARISQKTVARIMKEQGLQSRTVKKYKPLQSKHSYPIHAMCRNRPIQGKSQIKLG
ncbi:hypothetical protein CW304_21840 [Bacillus sp. UFRGS-B20]|nr:hypothetical protein CW304_21840 [Bacillus sp. UFRGS-B20]